MIHATINRRLPTEEVRELLYFMEHQETGDVTFLKNIGEGLKKIERGLFY